MNHFMSSSSVLAFALLVSGCGQSSSPETERQLSDAVEKIQTLQQKVDALEVDIGILKLVRNAEGIAYLTPGDEGYSVIRSDIGHLTVALQDIKPYANGSKVTLRLGNATAATINGINAKLEWGSVDGNGGALNETAKSRDVKFAETLNAGSWTSVNVVLDGVPPAELGFVRVRDVGHSAIRLSK